MANKIINDYPYTNMTYQNVDWLVDIVSKLVEKGKDNGEIKADDEVAAAYSQFINNYPYTNMTYQNIDWWINKVREIGAEQVKLIAQMETLQADVDNIVDKFGDKVDKLETKNVVYATDNSTPAKTIGIQYMESPFEGTIPIRDGIGSLQVPTAQDDTQAVNKGQMDTALNGKVDKTTEHLIFYGTDSNGKPYYYRQDSMDPTKWSVPIRNSNGAIVVGDAKQGNEAVNLTQMNTKLAGKLNRLSGAFVVYVNNNGQPSTIDYSTEPKFNTIPLRKSNGVVKVGTPVANNDATTKEYVDNAIATAPTGGWTTVIDKTWTEDEATDNSISIDIPVEYQKAMSELRMTYYNNTPQAGAVYSNPIVHIRLYDGEQTLAFMYTGNILPNKDTKEVTVNFQSVTNKNVTLYNSGISDLYSNCYGIFLYKDSNGNIVQPIPTDPNALLNTSKIIGTAEVPDDTTGKILDTCLPNRSHWYTLNNGPQHPTIYYTSNDYYNSGLPDCIISQVLTSTDETNLPVGSFICVQRQDLEFALNISIAFSETASVSYKNVVTRQASIVGESFQVIAGAESMANTMTSFNDTSINGNPLPDEYAYYSHLKNGYPTKVYLYPQSSTSNGVTANKIYSGSRIVLQAKY